MWPGDRQLCVLQKEPFVVLAGHAHWRQLTWAPPTAVPMPRQTSLVRGSEMPRPQEGWPVLSRPIPTAGSPEFPRLPWGLGQGGMWVEGTFWPGVGAPERESGPQGISETGRSGNLMAGNEEQLFWRKEALGMETPLPARVSAASGCSHAGQAHTTPQAGPLCCPPICLEKSPTPATQRPLSWVPAEVTLAYCIIYYSSPGRRTCF